MENDLNSWISHNVRVLLAHRGLNNRSLEPVLGLDSGTVSRMLHGKRRWTPEDVLRVAQLLDVSLDVLFSDPESLVRSRCFAAFYQHAPPDMPGVHAFDGTPSLASFAA